MDCGCGPGRDLLYFKERCHEVVGLDACQEFCEMATKISGCKVYCQAFENM